MMSQVDRFKTLLAQVSYPGLALELTHETEAVCQPSVHPGRYFLRWTDPSATCNTSGEALHSKGRKWRLSQHMVDGEVVSTAFKALLTYLEHEAREQFTFQGVSVYDSHVDIYKLVELRKEPDSIVGRAPPRDEPSTRKPLTCPTCGSTIVSVARDMKATRQCRNYHRWLPKDDVS
jgi:transcription elongation factor Elf1